MSTTAVAPLVLRLATESDGCKFQVARASVWTGAATSDSPWHDVRLDSANHGRCSTCRFVVEITKGELIKREVSLGKNSNPFEENEKATNKLKAFGQAPPFNYGIFPQTYCAPADEGALGIGGDDAPLDCVELSGQPLEPGSVNDVEVVGAFCVVDKKQMDWKIFTVRSETQRQWVGELGLLGASLKLMEEAAGALAWFEQWYKHKGSGEYPYGLELLPQAVALNEIHRAHEGWSNLVRNPSSASLRGMWVPPIVHEGPGGVEEPKHKQPRTA